MILEFIVNSIFATLCFVVFGTLLSVAAKVLLHFIKKTGRAVATGMKIPLDKLVKPW